MKKIILFASLFLLLNTGCKHTEIKEDQVPGVVVASFKAKYPDATETKWYTEKDEGKTIYEARFKSKGEQMETEFNEDGSVKKED